MGLFGISEDHLEQGISLDQHFLVNRASTFLFKQASDAMFPLIMKGDILIIDRARSTLPNQTVVCSYQGELIVRKIKNNRLIAINPKYKELLITAESEFQILGPVIATIREFQVDRLN